MSKYVFLYRLKDSDDRDACAYIEKPGRWECDHYFGSVILHGSCYCGHDFAPYDEIETVLTRGEYQQLIDYSGAMNLLGYGITKGDARYQAGIVLTEQIMPIWEKLIGEEGETFYEQIKQSEDEWLMDEYDLDEEDLALIWDEYGLDYHDRSVVGYVWNDIDECAEEEADAFGYVDRNDPASSRYFNYEQFGEDLLQEERYLELSDGRVVILNY